MIEAEGIVVRTENSIAFVETQRQPGCGSCSSSGSCGVASLSRLFRTHPGTFRVQNPVGAIAGEGVVIGVEEKALLKGSLVLYALPLFLLLLGAVAASLVAPSPAEKENYSIIGATLGLVVGGAGLRLAAGPIGSNSRYQPIILRKISNRKTVCFSQRNK
jgi:sigma-E factor negative regulatory protein RseC